MTAVTKTQTTMMVVDTVVDTVFKKSFLRIVIFGTSACDVVEGWSWSTGPVVSVLVINVGPSYWTSCVCSGN